MHHASDRAVLGGSKNATLGLLHWLVNGHGQDLMNGELYAGRFDLARLSDELPSLH